MLHELLSKRTTLGVTLSHTTQETLPAKYWLSLGPCGLRLAGVHHCGGADDPSSAPLQVHNCHRAFATQFPTLEHSDKHDRC